MMMTAFDSEQPRPARPDSQRLSAYLLLLAVCYLLASTIAQIHPVQAQSEPPASLQDSEPPSRPLLDFSFGLNTRNNLDYVYVAVAFLVSALLAHLHYMGVSLNEMRKGNHPTTVQFTTYAMWFGIFLIVASFIFYHADIGIYAAMAAVYIILLIILLLTAKLILPWVLLIVGIAIVCGIGRYMSLF